MKRNEKIISNERKAYIRPLTLAMHFEAERMMALSTTEKNATNNDVLTKGNSDHGNLWDDDEE